MNNRLPYIDKLKALAMILVVMGHTIYFCMYHEGTFNDYIFSIICTFHVPLFYFLSGVVISSPPTVLKFFAKSKRFLIPMLVVGFINALLIGKIRQFFLSSGHNGYWYLLTLTIFYMMLIPFRWNKERKQWAGFLIDILLAIVIWKMFNLLMKPAPVITNVFNIYGVYSYWPYFIIGYLTRKYNIVHFFKNLWSITILSLITYFILLFLLFKNINNLPIYLEMVVAITAIVSCMGLFYRTNNSNTWLDHQLLLIGNHTLNIYIYHYFFIRFINLDFLKTQHVLTELLCISILTILIVYASIGIEVLIDKIYNTIRLLNKNN